ncbi:ArdC family protein [Ferrimonas kyonanensis]|uniref:ArdC family protein n=1 Tax=Ferrimonas kyonanensis TaxID=364763 RepID=UPI0004246F8E|nr:zincin-like metallopeptidase domain-containing protein [Ferrimonas kyonanensis]
MKAKFDLYQHVTDQIIASLESGIKPWSCPWKKDQRDFGFPGNYFTGKHYSGINVLLLWAARYNCGFESDLWMTYKQGQQKGATVRKGEKGTKVVFAAPIDKEDKKTGEKEQVFIYRAFTVFNLDQFEGVEREEVVILTDFDVHKQAEDILQHCGANIIEQGSRAYYSHGGDYIKLPPRNSFTDSDNFYTTAFHEIGHWTGAKDRLARTFGKKFGDKDYAFEELIAELTAAFTGAGVGIIGEHLGHESYIASWLDKLKNDKRFIFQASAAAAKAHRYILDQVEQNKAREIAA